MNTVDLGLWDLDKISNRDRAVEYVREKKPAFIIGRPQSNMFSRLQNMNAWAGKRRQQYNEAVGHIRFVFELYQLQVREGRWFVHEHPKDSTSWKLKEVSSLRKVEGVFDVETDQCVYGLAARRKSARFLTNSKCMADELQWKYNEEHARQRVLNAKRDNRWIPTLQS